MGFSSYIITNYTCHSLYLMAHGETCLEWIFDTQGNSQERKLKVFNLFCVKSAPSTHGLLDMEPNKFLFCLNVFKLVLCYLFIF